MKIGEYEIPGIGNKVRLFHDPEHPLGPYYMLMGDTGLGLGRANSKEELLQRTSEHIRYLLEHLESELEIKLDKVKSSLTAMDYRYSITDALKDFEVKDTKEKK